MLVLLACDFATRTFALRSFLLVIDIAVGAVVPGGAFFMMVLFDC